MSDETFAGEPLDPYALKNQITRLRADLAAVTAERDYVMAEGLFSADQIRILKAERDTAIAERDAAIEERDYVMAEGLFRDEQNEDLRKTVSKIWEQLGNPTYKELNGRTIHDLIDSVIYERNDIAARLAAVGDDFRRLTADEQKVFHSALRRSAKIKKPVEDEALVERDALKKAVEAEQSMTKLRLGPFLKKVRQEKQMTLRAVEEATDKEISNAYLSQLESGKVTKPSPHVLYTLSLVFGVAYETLMERAGYIMPAPNRLAPVEDEALVEIAAHCEAIFDGWTFSSLERLSQDVYRVRAHQLLASIRPHIEAAERERCAKIAETPDLWVTDKPTRGCDDIAAAIRSGK